MATYNQMQVQQKPKFSVAITTKGYQSLISNTLRDPARSRRFTASITSAVAVNPALQECDAGTILAGALLGESLNLSPSPQLGQYYLVPFKQKAKYDRNNRLIRPESVTAQFVLGYAELDKIESVEDKNKALEALGTQNFRRVMQEVLENQKWEHRKAEWIADLKKFAIEDPNATYQTHEHVTGYSKWNITKDVVVPEDADHVQYFYKVSSGQIDLYKTRDVAAEDAEKAKRDAAREEERMIGESFHNITELMFNLRREFVVELTPTDCKKGFPAIARYMACAADDNFDLDLTLIGNILGVELSQEFVDSSGKDWYKILDEDGVYGTMPEKVLLALAYSSMDSSYCGYWSKDWNVERQKYVYSYRENPTLDATYEMLTALGYEISDDEQALRDGTHKIFREYGPDEKKWSDCDYCKAAHPNCDKCCKTCDEPCNAVQDCKKNEERTENDE